MSNINEIENNIVGSFEANTIKTKIVDGIKTATANGTKLISGEWFAEGAACALGCMLLAKDKDAYLEEDDSEETAAEMLGVDTHWINSFIHGFDGSPLTRDVRSEEAFKLGLELRTTYNARAKVEEDDEEDCDEEFDEDDCDDEDDNSCPKVI